MLLLKNYTNLWWALSNSLSRWSKSWAKNSHKLFFHCPGELRLGGFLPNSPEHSWHQSCFLWDVTEPKLSIPPQICHFTQTGSGTFTRGTFNRTQPLPGITKPNYPSSSGFWSSSFDIPQRRAWRNSASGFTQALPASEKRWAGSSFSTPEPASLGSASFCLAVFCLNHTWTWQMQGESPSYGRERNCFFLPKFGRQSPIWVIDKGLCGDDGNASGTQPEYPLCCWRV